MIMGRVWFSSFLIALLFQLVRFCICGREEVATPPLPVLPLPSYSQLKWQQREITSIVHFGVNTFTDSEWGDGHENPAIFNPTGVNTTQWATVAAEAGISLMVFIAKHHDGFCLWPSKYTDHSVIASPWKGGKGDVVQEFMDAATDKGIDVGIYLSPWDKHDPRYGDDLRYNEYYLAQLQELLKKYQNVKEIWFDGAKDLKTKNMSYYYSEWFSMLKELQSSINIFSDAGPNIRWVSNENGYAADTCWSTINGSALSIGNPKTFGYLFTGDSRGTHWIPAVCDVSIRKGWFWHKSESPKTLSQLLDIYYTSVGRNCLLALGIPINTTGLISDTDAQVLKELRSAVNTIFHQNLAEGCSVNVSSQRGGNGGGFGPENMLDSDHLWSYWAPKEDADEKDHWIEIRSKNGSLKFNVVRIQEAIGLGQRIKRHEIYVDGKRIIRGTTVGYKRLHRVHGGVVNAHVVRIKITKARAVPLISSVGLHFDPFWQSRFILT